MLHYFKKNHGLPAGLVAGFTLIELLISISIVSVILTIVLFKQSTYTETAALTNLADEIGLTISQAQVYGIGVKELAPGSSDFSASYGLSFSLLGSGSNSAYIYFADRDDNKIYDNDWSCPTGGSSECLEKTDITRGNYIESLCVSRTSGTDICNLDRVDISFARPSTEAQLAFFNNGGQPFNPANIEGARIILKSPNGLIRSVIVYKTGQISIESGYQYLSPTVSISASPNPVSYNSASILSWSSINATSCNASGNWNGNKATSGSQSTGNLTSNQTYTLTCTGLGGSASNSVTVVASAANIPPTANAGPDKAITLPTTTSAPTGTSATDSDGTISSTVWSFVSGPSTPTITNGTTLNPSFSNMTSAGTYVFRLTATDNQGATGIDNMQVVVTAAASCNLPWGGSISSGSSVTAYLTSTVPYGSSCSSQTRTCTNGSLSGSYQYPSCSVLPAASCNLPWGGSISSGSSVTAYLTSTVPYGSSCSSQTRTCTNGSLSGSYQYPSCSVLPDPRLAKCSACGGSWDGTWCTVYNECEQGGTAEACMIAQGGAFDCWAYRTCQNCCGSGNRWDRFNRMCRY